MTRSKKALYTSIFSILHQILVVVCGFVLPRFFLTAYGSEINGLVSSITQFLGFIALAELGVGVVVQSALYKPLAENDINQISRIFKSSKKFFNTIGCILLVYTLLMAFIYPLIVKDTFEYFFTALLVLIISINIFAQYYIGINYRLILGADQYGFITQGLACATLIVNTAACIILIKCGQSIHVVKLCSSLLFLIQPIVLYLIAKRKYKIIKDIELRGEPIKQKWNGLAQHIASVVNNNTDVIVLTLFSTLKDVSIYAVYYMVVNGIKNIVSSLTNGLISMFGNMLAKDEIERANKTFDAIETLIHTVTILLFTITGVLIVPFVSIYTQGITDANYIVYPFGILLTVALGAYCLRLPYNIIVMAAGHYKETQVSAIIEAILNIVVSIAFVFSFGLIGVAIGTLTAMLFRTIYLAWYLSKNILKRKIGIFIKHCLIDVLCIGIMIVSTYFIDKGANNYFGWFILALECGGICLACDVVINLAFYYKDIKMLFFAIIKRTKKGKA